MPNSIRVAQGILARMRERRRAEKHSDRAGYTMCYAVSVRTGICYVGYNMPGLRRDDRATECAETRASYVAKSYGEEMSDLVFFAMNNNEEMFNACSDCQRWLVRGARGFLKNQNQEWVINTQQYVKYEDRQFGFPEKPLSQDELNILSGAGEREISEESKQYFATEQWRN